LAAVGPQAWDSALLPGNHFSVDGTLIEALASIKSFRPKDDGGKPLEAGHDDEEFRGISF